MEYINAVNWNDVVDEKDVEVWHKLTSQFWLPEKIALSNDLKSWATLTDQEKLATTRALTGLTLLDTLQGSVGMIKIMEDSQTPHEEAVIASMAFMEHVHAKSYSSIFSTLLSSEEIEDTFRWSRENAQLQYKARIITDLYNQEDPVKRKIASVYLESFLFYSSFYLPLYWSAKAKLTNTADIIRLIIRDECLTGDHELLTPTGWKNIADITEEDLVLQFNADTKTTNFAHPVQVSKTWTPEIHDFRTEQEHIKLSVSPNHRLYMEKRTSAKAIKAKGTEKAPFEVLAKDVNGSDLNPYKYTRHGGYKQGTVDHLSPEQRLLIAISADGNYDRTKNKEGEFRRSGINTGTVPVTFSFSKEHKIERIQALATEAGWVISEGAPAKEEGAVKEKRVFRLQVPVAWVDRDKLLPNISDFEDISGTWCREFIQELANWDGHWVEGQQQRITWVSTVKENALYVQAVAAMAGYRTHYRVRVDNRSDNYSDNYVLQINTNIETTNNQNIKHTIIDGQEVYGVEVPSSYLITRNNGSVLVTGNSVHGYYIGYKAQKHQEGLTEEEKEAYKEFAYELLYELYENEVKYTHLLYDDLGLAEDVKKFVQYNANKALMNLGYDPLFSAEQTAASPTIISALSLGGENHDFFSGGGSTYLMPTVEDMSEEDWTF